MFWNVENYFDPKDDSIAMDDDFTPTGKMHWTWKRFCHKRDGIMKVIAAAGGKEWNLPVLVGLAEVEDDYVLYSLCKETPMRRWGYGFIHFDSPDRRGIDCALLYRNDRFVPFESCHISLSDSTKNIYTRDLLLVGGVLDGKDSIYVMVVHLPSKLGGAEAQRIRISALRRIRETMDSVMTRHPEAKGVVMGDFNADGHERLFGETLGLDEHGRNRQGWRDLLWDTPHTEGTYKYQNEWSCIDHILSNIEDMRGEIFAPSFLMTEDRTHQGLKPARTYLGPKYLGGLSDHLPIIGAMH